MRWRYLLLLSSIAGAAACAGLPTRAKAAYERGDYLAAAELYDEVVRADPDDSDAVEMRASSRRRALAGLLEEASRAKGGRLPTYATKLGAALEKRNAWADSLDSEGQAAFARELKAAVRLVRARVGKLAEGGRPLAAEAAFVGAAPLLDRPELGGVRRELVRDVLDAGAAECARHSKRALPASPYFTLMLARYCQHFDAPPPKTIALPDLRAAPVFEGTLAGATTAQVGELERRVAERFALSVWHSPSAKTPVRIAIRGLSAATFAKRHIALEAHWTEQVPYTASESVQVPHQVSYTTTEGYTESVPQTSSESYTYSCGTGTCTGSRPVTRYQSQYRTRQVTRYRTEYKTEQRSVTRYRAEPRIFKYEADEHSGFYSIELELVVDLRLPSSIAVELRQDDHKTGLEHDVSFPPAHVAPSRPGLPLAEEWYELQLYEIGKRLDKALLRAWSQTFCELPAYALEEAARCAYASPTLPRAAASALSTAIGEDAELLTLALARPSLARR